MDFRVLNTVSIKIRIMFRPPQYLPGICFRDFKRKQRSDNLNLKRKLLIKKLEEARKQIELQVINTMNELLTSEKRNYCSWSTSQKCPGNIQAYQQKNMKRDRQACSNLLMPGPTLTQAEENLIISKIQLFIRLCRIRKGGLQLLNPSNTVSQLRTRYIIIVF